MTEPIRIVFAGTPAFAVPPLKSLSEQGFKPVAVYTQPDRPAGRGKKLKASEVKEMALTLDIPVIQRVSLNSSEAQAELMALRPDLLVVVAYGLILPPAVLALPTFGCWNIHASLLPRWRGAAPIQRAIEAGDPESGVSIMKMDEGLDTGPVLMESRTPLSPLETSASLHDRLAEMGASGLLRCVRALVDHGPDNPSLTAVPQLEQFATYARKLTKAEAMISWEEKAQVIERRVRAFNPWPLCWFTVNKDRTRLWKSTVLNKPIPTDSDSPGQVIKCSLEGIDIATGDGILRLLELQPAGGRRMNTADFLNSRSMPEILPGYSSA